ncbi:class I SAM-dependent methyltransferase [Candidatus Cytomitobacter primus]|uniref:Methyltransferase domain-containing protein n=1 Tax=Candidatus Cytomitobacter primus TaxID=2066024 RepID=A0A5C0UGZ9_9PROT|nr:rRNA adenine N-6-methyltransferase family protein [Candidatus Cytomitobacter primus]QEK38572.1 hypothetical protein FZC34_01445 [Candidatus Cytomitobacter primus]
MSIFSKENIKFAKRWIKNPSRMGTFLPLSPKVGKKLIDNMPEISDNGYILEIGSGSGALTKFLYQNEKINKRIICIEIDKELCNILHSKFPELSIINQSAAELERYIDHDLLNKVEIIVSSIPFLSINKSITNAIINSCVKIMNLNHGKMLHVSYTPFVRIKSSNYGMKKIFCKPIWGVPITYLNCYEINNDS